MNMTSKQLFKDLRQGANSMLLACSGENWVRAWSDLKDVADKLVSLYEGIEVTSNNDGYQGNCGKSVKCLGVAVRWIEL